jgi:hypothetical protein
MSRLNQPLKTWHGLIAIVAALFVGGAGTAIATSDKQAGPGGAAKSNLGSDHGYTYVSDFADNPAGEQTRATVNCGKGKVAVGGGGVGSASGAGEEDLNGSFPNDGNDADDVPSDGWGVYADNTDSVAHTVTVYAVCKKVG